MAVAPRQSQARDIMQGNGDELLFGDFCFTCGNSTDGNPYCSQECRLSDANRPLLSPDFSPALSPVPLLVSSSAKSINSTPTSSANNSPSPPNGIALSDDHTATAMDGDGHDEFPKFELPGVASKFDYGGASLPNGLRYPSHFAVAYVGGNGNIVHGGGDYSPKEFKPLSFGTANFEPLDLTRRRKPSAQVPAPLYFREAARVHSSPALVPSSPPVNLRFSPRHFPPSPPITANIPSFALPPARSCLPSTFAAPSFGIPQTRNCGRPGCYGTPASSISSNSIKEAKKIHSTVAASNRDSAEILLSPRIRALRVEDHFMLEPEEEEVLKSPEDEDVATEDPSQHSAFACYLFSHLSDPAPARSQLESKSGSGNNSIRSGVEAVVGTGDGVARGRSHQATLDREEEKRSMSVDSVFPNNHLPGVPSSTSRPSRFLFARGAAAHPTVSAPVTPGRLIPASTTSSAFTSPSASPYPSPPTVPTRSRSPPSRSRSARRRSPTGPTPFTEVTAPSTTNTANQQPLPSTTLDPRGRSKLRGIGAIEREYSPVRVESEGRESRGRQEDAEMDKARGRRRNSNSRSREGLREEEDATETRGRRGRS